MNEPVLLYWRHEGTVVPPRLVDLIFQARTEASSFLQPWRCPPRARHRAAQRELRRADVERQEAMRLAEAQERAVAEQERQRRQQERQQWVVQALIEQRGLFEPGLQQPFEADDVEFFHQGAAVFRFAVNYLGRPPLALLLHFEQNAHHVLAAKRCWHCHRPILCLDSSEYVGEFRIYYPWVEYFRPPEGDRGYLISKCRQCGRRQRRRDLYEGKHVTLDGRHLATWLAAFHSTAQPDKPRR